MKKIISSILAVATVFTLVGCQSKEKSNTIEIYTPDGAPALGLAKNMYEDTENDNVNYHVVDSQTISTWVSGEKLKADICVLPVNLASKLLGSGETYQMLGTLTHGNLYIISTVDISIETGSDFDVLYGGNVGVIQLANVPGLTFQSILKSNGIKYTVSTGTKVENDGVGLMAVDPANVVPMSADANTFIVAEPMATTKVKATSESSKPFRIVGDLQKLYGGEKGYPQAVVVAKKSLISKNPDFVNGFISTLSENQSWLDTVEVETVCDTIAKYLTSGLKPSLTVNNLDKTVISRCNVWYEPMKDCKEDVVNILNNFMAIQTNSANAVSDKFFYLGK